MKKMKILLMAVALLFNVQFVFADTVSFDYLDKAVRSEEIDKEYNFSHSARLYYKDGSIGEMKGSVLRINGTIDADSNISGNKKTSGITMSSTTAQNQSLFINDVEKFYEYNFAVNNNNITSSVTVNNSGFYSSGRGYESVTGKGNAIYSLGYLEVNNSTFNANRSFYGGAIASGDEEYGQGENSIYLTNVLFDNNMGWSGGAFFNDVNSAAYLTDVNFYKNYTSNSVGGAVVNKGTMLIQGNNSLFSENQTFGDIHESHGGAIFNDGILDIKGYTRFVGNISKGDGGAIYVADGIVTISSSTEFVNNTSWSGGAIYINAGTVNLQSNSNDIIFTGNKASWDGEAIYVNDGAELNLQNVIFNNNGDSLVGNTSNGILFNKGEVNGYNLTFSSNTGCAVYNSSGTVILNGKNLFSYGNSSISSGQSSICNSSKIKIDNGVQFLYNKGGNNGGAIYNSSEGNITIQDNSVFDSNRAISIYGLGGAVFNDTDGTIVIGDNALFSSNRIGYGTSDSQGKGGAIANKGTMEIGKGSSFISNIAECYGGAIFNSQGYLTIKDDARFISNVSAQGSWVGEGGAICIYGGIVNIGDNVLFSSNTSSKIGGAIYNSYYNNPELVIGSNALFNYNHSQEDGGAIYNDSIIIIQDGAKFINNMADTENGGAIHNRGILNLIADTNNIEFTGNTANGISNAITNDYMINLYASDNADIIFNDRITTTRSDRGVFNINNSTTTLTATGKIILNEDMSGFNGAVNLYAGEIELKSKTEEDSNINTNKFFSGNVNGYGGTLNLLNNAIDTITLERFNVYSDLNLKFDMDLSNNTSDNFTEDTIFYIYSNGVLNLTSINILGINEEAESGEVKLINHSISGLADKDRIKVLTTASYNEKEYKISVSKEIYGLLEYEFLGNRTFKEIVNDNNQQIKSYSASEDINVLEDLDELGGTQLSIFGNGNNIVGNDVEGIFVGKDKILDVQDVNNWGGFTSTYGAIKNEGTVYLSQTNFSGNEGQDIINNGNLILQDSFIGFEKGITGTGELTIQNGFINNTNITQSTITVVNGTLVHNLGENYAIITSTNIVVNNGATVTAHSEIKYKEIENNGLLQIDVRGEDEETAEDLIKNKDIIKGTGELQILTSGFTNENTITQGTITVTNSKFANEGQIDLLNKLSVENSTFTNKNCINAKEINVKISTFTNKADGIINAEILNNEGEFVNEGSLILTNSIENKGTITSQADLIQATINNTGNLILTGGTNANSVTGTGTTIISGEVINSSTIANALIITGENSRLTSTLASLEGTVTVESDGKLNLQDQITDGILGTGEIILNEQQNISSDISYAGTINMNEQTINMQNTPATYNTVEVGSLKGNGNIKIDVDMTTVSGKAKDNDKINITDGLNNGGTLKLISVNVTDSGDTSKTEYADYITYVSGETVGLTFDISALSTITTDNRRFVFTQGSDGKLNVTIREANTTLAQFIDGDNIVSPVTDTTFSFTKNLAVNEDLGTTRRDNDTPNELYLYLNNNELSSDGHNGITTDKGYVLNVDSGTVKGFSTAFSVTEGSGTTADGTLNLKDITLTGNTTDIENNGNVNFYGTNKLNNITGTGSTLIASGASLEVTNDAVNSITQNNLTVENNAELTANANTLNISNGITNNGTINFTGGTNNNEISGTGELTVQNGLINNANIAQNAITVLSGTFEHNCGAGENMAVIKSTDIVINSGATLIAHSEIDTHTDNGKVTNNGIVNIDVKGEEEEGYIGNVKNYNIFEGTGELIISSTTFENYANIEQKTITIADIDSSLTTSLNNLTAEEISNKGLLTLTGGENLSKITGTGTTIIDGEVLNSSTIATAVTINAQKKLTTAVDSITGKIENNGRLELNNNGENKNWITGTGTTIIDGEVLNSSTIATAVTINAQKKLTTTATDVVGNIENKGSLILTGGTNNNEISGNGNLIVNDSIWNYAGIEQKNITIKNGFFSNYASDDITAANLTVEKDGVLYENGYNGGNVFADNVYNDGFISIIQSDIDNNTSIYQGTGELKFIETDFVNAANIEQSKITIDSDSNMTTNANNITATKKILNDGNLKITGGENKNWIEGTGTTIIDGEVLNSSTIATAVTINVQKKLTTTATDVTGNILNNGILNFTGGINNNVISGTNGTFTVSGNFENNSVISQSSITINGIVKNNSNITAEDMYINGTFKIGENGSFYTATNSIIGADSEIDLQNGLIQEHNFGKLSINSGTVYLLVDADLETETMDTISATANSQINGTINVKAINVVKDGEKEITDILFTESDVLKNKITSINAASKLYKYDVLYDTSTGYFSFTKEGNNSPVIAEEAVASSVGGFITQTNIAGQAFISIDNQISSRNQAKKKSVLYASTANQIFETENKIERGLWIRPYAVQETIKFDTVDVDNTVTGTLAGIDLPIDEDKQVSFYIGYAGSNQKYEDIKITQTGYVVGATGMLVKDKWYAGLTANVIFNKAESQSNFGTDNFDMNMYSIGAKAGYNFDIGKNWMLEPNIMLMYGNVNSQEYETTQGAKIDSQSTSNMIVEPQVKAKWQLEKGWQPYGLLGYVANMNDKAKVVADNMEFELDKIDGYVEYGAGVNKDFINTPWNCYVQVTGRSGGRTGFAGNLGVKYKF
ncbi:MAG: hypothetical protein K5622_00020 [Endomicrobiaceae bacterium]|nr:hypothetical protein [Endomicrobiaceae bacterium]